MHNLQCAICGSTYETSDLGWDAIATIERCAGCDSPETKSVRNVSRNIIWDAFSVYYWNKYGLPTYVFKIWETAEWSISIV